MNDANNDTFDDNSSDPADQEFISQAEADQKRADGLVKPGPLQQLASSYSDNSELDMIAQKGDAFLKANAAKHGVVKLGFAASLVTTLVTGATLYVQSTLDRTK